MDNNTQQYQTKTQKFLVFSFYLTFLLITLGTIIGSTLFNFNIAGTISSLFFVLYKYAYFFALFIIIFFLKIKNRKVYIEDFFAFSYLIVFAFYALYYANKGLVFSSFLYLYIFPLFIFYAGQLFADTNIDLKKTFIQIQKIYLIYLIFGFIDYFFLGHFFWADIVNYANYIVEVKQMPMGIIDGLPGNLFYDPYGSKIRRFTSVFGIPLTFAYFSMTMLVLFLMIKPFATTLKNNIYLSLLVFSILLSITRAVYISMLLALLFLIPIKNNLKVISYLLVIIITNFLLFNAHTIFEAISYSDSSTMGHLNSNYEFVEEISILEVLFGNINLINTQFEPAIYNLIFYFGFFGFLFWITWFTRISLNVYKNQPYLTWLAAAGLTSMIFFSQSFLSITSSWLSWFLLGYFNSQILLNSSLLSKTTLSDRT